MKKFLFVVFLLVTAASYSNAQKIEIFWDDPTNYVVDSPTYIAQRIMPSKNKISINDSVFFSYVANMVGGFSKCESSCCKSKVWYGMIQVVIVYDDYNYDVVNMTHSMLDKTLDAGCLELNGKIMEYSKDFQEIMDEIVNYHIVYPSAPIGNRFLMELIKGKRYHLMPYIPESPSK